RGARVVSLDATSDHDLDVIVAEGLALGKRILWAGSGGLASALARTMPLAVPPAIAQRPADFKLNKPTQGPVLFCIGSDHPATLAQQARLLAERTIKSFLPANTAGEEIAASLLRGEHVLLRIPRGGATAGTLRGWIVGAPAAALLLSGGETASAVCEA